jgi:hypothetical protein
MRKELTGVRLADRSTAVLSARHAQVSKKGTLVLIRAHGHAGPALGHARPRDRSAPAGPGHAWSGPGSVRAVRDRARVLTSALFKCTGWGDWLLNRVNFF